MVKTISHLCAELTREILFLPQEHKITIYKPTCSVRFIIETKNTESNDKHKPYVNCTQFGGWSILPEYLYFGLLSSHFGIFGVFVFLSERCSVRFKEFNFPIARHLSISVWKTKQKAIQTCCLIFWLTSVTFRMYRTCT